MVSLVAAVCVTLSPFGMTTREDGPGTAPVLQFEAVSQLPPELPVHVSTVTPSVAALPDETPAALAPIVIGPVALAVAANTWAPLSVDAEKVYELGETDPSIAGLNASETAPA